MTLNDIIKKRYPFYDEDIQFKNIEIRGEAVKILMNDLINEIRAMYIPDGNPQIWLAKIIELQNKV